MMKMLVDHRAKGPSRLELPIRTFHDFTNRYTVRLYAAGIRKAPGNERSVRCGVSITASYGLGGAHRLNLSFYKTS